MCCGSGPTTHDILEKLQGLLDAFPIVMKVIVHIDTTDTALLFVSLISQPVMEKDAFISGPVPMLGCGWDVLAGWLKSVCREHNISFIHNFDLF